LDFLAEVGPEVKAPFAEPPEWMVLIDLGCFAGTVPEEALEGLFAEAFERQLVVDGVIAASLEQRLAFWAILRCRSPASQSSSPAANRN